MNNEIGYDVYFFISAKTSSFTNALAYSLLVTNMLHKDCTKKIISIFSLLNILFF